MIDTILAKSVQALVAGVVAGTLVHASSWALGFSNEAIKLHTNVAVLMGMIAVLMAHRGKA